MALKEEKNTLPNNQLNNQFSNTFSYILDHNDNDLLNTKITAKIDTSDDEIEQEIESFTDAKVADQTSSVKSISDSTYTVVPLRNMVINQQLIISLFVGRKSSIKAIEENDSKNMFFVLQKSPNIEKPKASDLHEIGTVARILHIAQMPDKTLKITIEGLFRAKSLKYTSQGNKMLAEVEALSTVSDNDTSTTAKLKSLQTSFIEYSKLKKQYSSELIEILKDIQDPFVFIDFISMHTEIDHEKKQALLAESVLTNRIDILMQALEYEIENIKLSNQITQNVKQQFENQHKKVLLSAKLEATRKALEAIEGDGDSGEEEIESFKQKLKSIPLSDEAKEKAEKEIRKLKSMSSMSTEATVIRTYLDWIFGLPWGQTRQIEYDLDKAKEALEANHYGLQKIKERIYEMIAVESRVGVGKSPILCLYGPPGVGKTSLARSIAEATGREFISVSLGGLHDEAELRGHRSTYIGAKPGKIIQGLRRAKTDNPVFLLDEIGEIGQDPRGNPAAALLEILDPEHRHEFRDNFLEVAWPFDKAMVVTSTNRLDNLPAALVDRMEIISLSGYTEDEKIHIALNHLIKKQKLLNGVSEEEIEITTDAIKSIINYYTREAGVRNLEREIAKICRKVVKQLVDQSKTTEQNKMQKIIITANNLQTYLGIPKYLKKDNELANKVGVVAGLAWTQVGGEMLYVEALTMPGKGNTIITGKLGDVMKESAQASYSFVKSKATKYNIDPSLFEKTDIHIHFPEGATPKDGPSAGIAICTAIASALTGRQVRGDLAMTGEISLRSKVLAIGGLKEKLLAAIRHNIKEVFIPQENSKDLEEITDEIDLSNIKITLVEDVEYVIDHALI